MKKIVLLISCVFALMFSGCTGVITGHEYTKTDLVIMYKVVKNGATTFMTQEQIESAKLDKVDVYVTDSYKLVTPEEASSATK